MRYLASRVCYLALVAVFANSQVMASSVEEGQAVYNEHCASCHGDGLRNPGSSFDLKQLKSGDNVRFIRSVLGGKNQMPPWKGVLDESQIESLWLYIRENADD